jgi:hypothetical protein
VRQVIRLLAESEVRPRPQLVVRTYAKGTSAEMKALAEEEHPGVVFPPVLWEPRWQMPLREDLQIYSNLLRHAAAGINAASTVSLELLMFDKPVINLDFDPLGTDLPWDMGFERHIRFDHYRPLAKSGAVMVARSTDDMRRMIEVALREPQSGERERSRFLVETFGDTLDGAAGLRVAETLLDLATRGGEKGGAS